MPRFSEVDRHIYGEMDPGIKKESEERVTCADASLSAAEDLGSKSSQPSDQQSETLNLTKVFQFTLRFNPKTIANVNCGSKWAEQRLQPRESSHLSSQASSPGEPVIWPHPLSPWKPWKPRHCIDTSRRNTLTPRDHVYLCCASHPPHLDISFHMFQTNQGILILRCYRF